MAELSGDLGKLAIDNGTGVVFLRFASLSVEEVVTVRPMRTFPDNTFRRDLPIDRQLRIRWRNASYDPTEVSGQNVFSAFTSIRGGNLVQLSVFTSGTSMPTEVYSCPLFLIDQNAQEFDASMLQPWSAGGMSQGPYGIPGSGFVIQG